MTMKDDLRKLAAKIQAESREKLLNTTICEAKKNIIIAASVGETSTTWNIDRYANDGNFCNAFLSSIKDDLPNIHVSVSIAVDGVLNYTFSWKD